AIEQAQKRVELQNFQSRKRLLEYDDVMNQQREVIYSLRLFALERGEEIKAEARRMIEAALERAIIQFLATAERPEEWDRGGLRGRSRRRARRPRRRPASAIRRRRRAERTTCSWGRRPGCHPCRRGPAHAARLRRSTPPWARSAGPRRPCRKSAGMTRALAGR